MIYLNSDLLAQLQECDAATATSVDRAMRCGAVWTLLHLRQLINERIDSLTADDPHDWKALDPRDQAPKYTADAVLLAQSVFYRDFWCDWAHKHDRLNAIVSRSQRAELLFQFLNAIEAKDDK